MPTSLTIKKIIAATSDERARGRRLPACSLARWLAGCQKSHVARRYNASRIAARSLARSDAPSAAAAAATTGVATADISIVNRRRHLGTMTPSTITTRVPLGRIEERRRERGLFAGAHVSAQSCEPLASSGNNWRLAFEAFTIWRRLRER